MRSSEWKQVWEWKAEHSDSNRALSGRSEYTPEHVRTLVEDARDGLSLDLTDSLLDVGCAGGLSGQELSTYCYCYVGLDYSLGALRRFTSDTVVCGTALSLPFRDKSFDKSHVGSVLLCLSREEACYALAELRRVTVTRAFVGGNLEVKRSDGATHYSREELAAMADWCGWKHVEIRDLSTSLPHASTMFDMVLS